MQNFEAKPDMSILYRLEQTNFSNVCYNVVVAPLAGGKDRWTGRPPNSPQALALWHDQRLPHGLVIADS